MTSLKEKLALAIVWGLIKFTSFLERIMVVHVGKNFFFELIVITYSITSKHQNYISKMSSTHIFYVKHGLTYY